jgi:lysophospholipase L1-like esterase
MFNHVKVFSLQNGPTAPSVTLIFFGENDSAILGSSSQRQHVPQDQYKDNLKKIVTYLKVLLKLLKVHYFVGVCETLL